MSRRPAWSRARAVAGKEILDFVRDWRTLLAVILIPLLTFPAMFLLLPVLLQSQAAELAQVELTVAVQLPPFDDAPVNLSSWLASETLLLFDDQVEDLPSGLESLAVAGPDGERIDAGEVAAVLRLDRTSRDPEQWSYAIVHDSTAERSSEAADRLFTIIERWEDELTNATLADARLERNATLDPVRLDRTEDGRGGDIASSGQQLAFLASLFIPLVLTLWTATSAIQPAIDLTAGERERGTLEALLTTPVGRLELLWGKWLAVASMVGLGVLMQVGALGVTMFVLFSAVGGELGLPSIGIGQLLLILIAVLVFAATIVAFELAVAMRSRSVREAGSVLGPMTLLFVIPAIVAQFVNLEGIAAGWFLVPVVNVLLALRELLQGDVDLWHTALWFGSSAVYASVTAWYAARQFGREDLVQSIT